MNQNTLLVNRLRAMGALDDDRIYEAFSKIDRSLFVPEKLKGLADEDEVIPTMQKGFRTISTNSQPSLVAKMLQWLDVQPHHRILEIGTGTGYMTALLAYLAQKGSVTSIDSEEKLTSQARQHLESLDFTHIHILTGDGYWGCNEKSPYDRIISSVATGDISESWFNQLKPEGVMVIPMIVEHGYTPVFKWIKTSSRQMRGQMKTGAIFISMQGHENPWLDHIPMIGETIDKDFGIKPP